MQSINAGVYKVEFLKKSFKPLEIFLKKKGYSSCFIACDENTMQHCLPILISNCPSLAPAEIIETESGEQAKSIEVTALICETLLERNAGRDAVIINLGGGVVSDIGGFCASIYKRGIDFINIPTSLLAMADASVGGKTGIDFLGVKNILGTFHQPSAVFIHSPFLQTLPQRHYKNGLAEIYKIALIADKSLWKKINELPAEELIYKSVGLKNKYVLKDPFDKGIRQQLNFGHTIGHALESLLLSRSIDVLHGEAIAAGMIMEAQLSWQKKMLDLKSLREITERISKELEMAQPEFSLEDLLPWLQQDKKNSGSKNQFALLNGIGKCKTGVEVTSVQLSKSILYYRQLHG